MPEADPGLLGEGGGEGGGLGGGGGRREAGRGPEAEGAAEGEPAGVGEALAQGGEVFVAAGEGVLGFFAEAEGFVLIGKAAGGGDGGLSVPLVDEGFIGIRGEFGVGLGGEGGDGLFDVGFAEVGGDGGEEGLVEAAVEAGDAVPLGAGVDGVVGAEGGVGSEFGGEVVGEVEGHAQHFAEEGGGEAVHGIGTMNGVMARGVGVDGEGAAEDGLGEEVVVVVEAIGAEGEALQPGGAGDDIAGGGGEIGDAEPFAEVAFGMLEGPDGAEPFGAGLARGKGGVVLVDDVEAAGDDLAVGLGFEEGEALGEAVGVVVVVAVENADEIAVGGGEGDEFVDGGVGAAVFAGVDFDAAASVAAEEGGGVVLGAVVDDDDAIGGAGLR